MCVYIYVCIYIYRCNTGEGRLLIVRPSKKRAAPSSPLHRRRGRLPQVRSMRGSLSHARWVLQQHQPLIRGYEAVPKVMTHEAQKRGGGNILKPKGCDPPRPLQSPKSGKPENPSSESKTWWTFRICSIFFSARGGGRASPSRRGGGVGFLKLKSEEKGGVSRRGGGGQGRMSGEFFGGGGGLILFFLGAETSTKLESKKTPLGTHLNGHFREFNSPFI